MKKLILILAVSLVLGVGTSALAAITPIFNSGEPSLIDSGGILDGLYGLSNLVRIDDDADISWILEGSSGTAMATTKYADYSQTLYAGTQPLFSVIGTGNPGSIKTYEVGTSTEIVNKTATITEAGWFKFYNDPSSDVVVPITQTGNIPKWSSEPSENIGWPNATFLGLDRMVTWKVKGYPNKYVMGWEDGTDRDYQDIVYEFNGVAHMPEPSSMVLLGMGILGLFGLGRKRKA